MSMAAHYNQGPEVVSRSGPTETPRAAGDPSRRAFMRRCTAGMVLLAERLGAASQGAGARMTETALSQVAERYVKLVLAVGRIDADYVDAYYGPPAWREEAQRLTPEPRALAETARELLAGLGDPPSAEASELLPLRHRYLWHQLQAVAARLRQLQGERSSFDAESKALYDSVSPTRPEREFRQLARDLESRLPGQGSLSERYQAFRQSFVIPKDRLDRVFQAALSAARSRTLLHLELPATESFRVEYVTGQPWSGYNWYQGQFQSLIQVNTDLPIFVDRAIDLACHEGYPGHHVYNALLESHLTRGRGWVEFSVYPLFSPQSLIAEGTANFGIDVAFPRDERLAFERETVFPLAGLDPARVGEYYDILAMVERLSYAGNEAARRYLDGDLDRAGAERWLVELALSSPAQAEQRVRFFDRYRSYVINYNHGRDLVRAHVERRGGTAARPDRRWREFGALLSSPRLPSGLAV